jgi:hypothetical protein
MLHSNGAWFILNGYENSQNKRYWSTEYPLAVHAVPLHDLKIGAWRAIRINGAMFSHETINSEHM